jgi:hypothetical protein
MAGDSVMSDKYDTLESIKGNTSYDFQEFIDAKWQETKDLNDNFRRERDANLEKFINKLEEDRKRLELLREELVEYALGEEEASNWRMNYRIKIVITKEETA